MRLVRWWRSLSGLAKLVLGLAVLFILEPYLMPNPRLDTVPGIISSVFGTLTLWALVFAQAVWLVRFLNRRRVPQTLGPGETPTTHVNPEKV
jgi:hypothetical protein